MTPRERAKEVVAGLWLDKVTAEQNQSFIEKVIQAAVNEVLEKAAKIIDKHDCDWAPGGELCCSCDENLSTKVRALKGNK